MIEISLLGLLTGSGTVSSFLQKILDLIDGKKEPDPNKIKLLIIQETLPIINQLYSYFETLKIIREYQKEHSKIPDSLKLALRSQLESMALAIEHWKTTGLDLLILGVDSEGYSRLHTLLLFLKGNLMDKSWPSYSDPSGGKILKKHVYDLLASLIKIDLDEMAEYFVNLIKKPTLTVNQVKLDHLKDFLE